MKFVISMRPEWNSPRRMKFATRGSLTVSSSSYDFPTAASVEVVEKGRIAINFVYDFSPQERLVRKKYDSVIVDTGEPSGRIMRLDFPMRVLLDDATEIQHQFLEHFDVDPRSTLPGNDIRRSVHYATVGNALPAMADMIDAKLKELRGEDSSDYLA